MQSGNLTSWRNFVGCGNMAIWHDGNLASYKLVYAPIWLQYCGRHDAVNLNLTIDWISQTSVRRSTRVRGGGGIRGAYERVGRGVVVGVDTRDRIWVEGAGVRRGGVVCIADGRGGRVTRWCTDTWL